VPVDVTARQALRLHPQIVIVHRHEDAPLGAGVLNGDGDEPVDDPVERDFFADGQ
jgi:hypothetical protein